MSKPIRELNLELGRPDAAEALRRLAAEVEAARHLGIPGRNSLYSMRRHGGGWPCVPACGRIGTWTRKIGALPLCC